MPPHGSGFTGASHSHNPEFPDDEWNLYTQVDAATVQGLNVTHQPDVVGIFKPFALRLIEAPAIFSDSDEELMITLRFISPVHIRKLMIIGGGNSDELHPNELKCFVNHENMDFTSIDAVQPAQIFTLPINTDGTVELITSIHSFTNVNVIAFYFPSNHGNQETTSIRYIGMQGDHTHYRREAVHTQYELLCTHQDIAQHGDDMAQKEAHIH